MMSTRVVQAVVLVLGFSFPGYAELIFTFTGGTPTYRQNFTYGFQFKPIVDITVDALGFFDADQNGLFSEHRAGIWTTTGILLASTTVATATSTLDGPVINGGRYRFTSIPRLELNVGASYVFGVAIEGAPDIWYYGGTNISTSPALAKVSSVGYFKSGNFVFPNQWIPGSTYAAGSLRATATHPTIVPEPPSIILLCCWLSTIGAAAYRHKTRYSES
jgi:hypothetical protein